MAPIASGFFASSAPRPPEWEGDGSEFYSTMIYKPEVVVIVLILMLPLPQAVWIICFLLAVVVVDFLRSNRVR